MKLNYFYSLLLLLIVSCTQPSGVIIPTANTYEIDQNDTEDSIIVKAAHVVPTKNQYEALKNEFIAFIHFGPNTFTRKEWGSGMESPDIFDLKNLDTDQWCEAMKSAGMKKVILTVKHHDGFCLWQTRYTDHGIMSTSFEDGKGDILKELSESCQKYGLKLGIYLSPADLYQIEHPDGLYGNLSEYTERIIPRPVEGRPFENETTFKYKVDDYNEYFLNQLFELLTEYGPVHELWFDGAHPKRKGGQTYNEEAWEELIRTLAPEAVIFGMDDIRWCGNESGSTRETEWNVIPCEIDNMADLLGSREQLFQANCLTYQMAETNTSIREGWFYRDDTSQKTRSTDDVFDIYERSVGGNSIFLLNIPPNREGLFSQVDVDVLTEVGERIRETYTDNLLSGAKGPKKTLDGDEFSYELLDEGESSIEFTTSSPITTNRFVLQEAITTHSERIEKHALDAWVDGAWEEVATATNIGYKRILRFPEITSNKFRIRVLASRLQPAISNVSAHYYKTRPPQLSITRDIDGMVTIKPKEHVFQWKSHGIDVAKNIHKDLQIRYTLDGTTPTKESKLYENPFLVESGEVKATSFSSEESGSEASSLLGVIKNDWVLIAADSESENHSATNAFDANSDTYWLSSSTGSSHYISIDLNQERKLTGFTYTPQTENSEGMIEKGTIKISEDGKSWKVLEEFGFGNLINDPSPRRHYFEKPVNTRYIMIQSNVIAGGSKSAAIAEIDFLKE